MNLSELIKPSVFAPDPVAEARAIAAMDIDRAMAMPGPAPESESTEPESEPDDSEVSECELLRAEVSSLASRIARLERAMAAMQASQAIQARAAGNLAPVPTMAAAIPAYTPAGRVKYSRGEYVTVRDQPAYLAIPEGYLTRNQYQAERARAEAMGGWYRRKQADGSAGGFAFNDSGIRDQFAGL